MADNTNFLLIAVFFTLIISVGFLGMAKDFNTKRDLDDQSKEYLSTIDEQYNDSGFNSKEIELKSLDKKTNPLMDKVGNIPLVSDILGAVNFFKEKTAFVWSFISTVFGIPTFLVASTGINVGFFSIYINILGGLLFIWALIELIKLVK
jgi:hypothetical protein